MENKQIFSLTLDNKFNQGSVLQDHIVQRTLKVVSEPKHKYYKWYHKLLNKLTFGKRFVEGWEYNVISEPIKIKWGLL
jgi:hypothetical protein